MKRSCATTSAPSDKLESSLEININELTPKNLQILTAVKMFCCKQVKHESVRLYSSALTTETADVTQ